MKLRELSQILSHTPLIEKTQQGHQKMDEEAKKLFLMDLHKQLMRKDKQVTKPPETKGAKLEERREGKKEEKREKKKKEDKTKGNIDIRV